MKTSRRQLFRMLVAAPLAPIVAKLLPPAPKHLWSFDYEDGVRAGVTMAVQRRRFDGTIERAEIACRVDVNDGVTTWTPEDVRDVDWKVIYRPGDRRLRP